MSDSAQVPATTEKAPAPARWNDTVAAEVGLPSSDAINAMSAVATLVLNGVLCTPDLIPEGNHHPDDLAKAIKANAVGKMLFGRELGLQPLESLTSVFIIKGRFCVHYSKLLGVVQRQGWSIEYPQWDTTGCKLVAVKNGTRIEAVYGPDEATKAGLAGLDNYKKRPEVMYLSKAAGKLYRALGISGPLAYTREEAAEIEPDQPIDRMARIEAAAGSEPPDDDLIPVEIQSALRDAYGPSRQREATEKLKEIEEWLKDPGITDKALAVKFKVSLVLGGLKAEVARKIANGDASPAPVASPTPSVAPETPEQHLEGNSKKARLAALRKEKKAIEDSPTVAPHWPFADFTEQDILSQIAELAYDRKKIQDHILTLEALIDNDKGTLITVAELSKRREDLAGVQKRIDALQEPLDRYRPERAASLDRAKRYIWLVDECKELATELKIDPAGSGGYGVSGPQGRRHGRVAGGPDGAGNADEVSHAK